MPYSVIKVGGECIGDADLPSYIASLNQIGKFPIIVLGAGKQIDELLKKRKIPARVDRERITDLKTLECVVEAAESVSETLLSEINEYGGCAQSLVREEILKVNPDKNLGYVGEPIGVDKKLLDIVRIGKSPILGPIGYDSSHQKYNVSADSVACSIIQYLGADKFSSLIFVNDIGGVFDNQGRIAKSISSSKIESLIKNRTVTGGMAEKIIQARNLLSKSVNSNPNLKIKIVSPYNLHYAGAENVGTEIRR